MTKGNTEHRKSLIQRVDHLEKIIELLADRLNNEIVPLLRRNEKAIEKNRQTIEGIVEWLDRSRWQRMKDRLPW